MTTIVLVLHAAGKVEDFGCDFLLSALVVGKGKFGYEVLGIVGSNLHCDGPGSVFK